MASIFAFGNPVYDDIVTPVSSTQGRVLSGCSTNACIALAHLGRRSTLVGRLGADYAGQFADDLGRFGIAASVRPCAQTGGFRLNYDARGDRTLHVLGVADQLDHLPPGLAGAEAIIIGPILQETPRVLVEQIAAQSDAPLFLDPQGLLRQLRPDGQIAHFRPDDFADVARLCRVVKANEVEAHVLTGVDPRRDPAAAARRLREFGCAIAIVTLAEAGSFIDDGRRQIPVPAYATDASDPTGAGDTYMAGFLHAYLQNPDDLFGAGCLGAAVASIWIEHTGPDAPLRKEEALRRAARLVEDRPG